MRDLRTLNMTEGQKIESDLTIKKIGDLSYRNFGTFSKMGLFDNGKALIVGDGIRVEPSSGMTVNVPSGVFFQRFVDVIPCLQTSDQTVTLDAATGVARTDIIEAQVKVIADKVDVVQTATVASGTAVSITNEEIRRDMKYYLSARKQTGTTTPTAATAATLTGTVAIPSTIDLSEDYLLNLADGEDGSFQEIDCRGATPEATTLAEIVANINAAVGRVAASIGGGNVLVYTGTGTGICSCFTIKPPVTDADKDCASNIFGLSTGGAYRYEYVGTNEWIKIAEIDVGTATTTITASLIRNIDRKDTWTGDIDDVTVHDYIYQPNISEWNKYSSTVTYALGDITYIGEDQYVSLKNANLNNYPTTNPNYWEIAPNFVDVVKDFQNGKIIWPGLKNIDNYRHADYAQWNFAGYYSNDGKSFESYKVRLDGTQITGDADLVSIFDVSGSSEYFLIDTLAPDVAGTRTLPDLRGRTVRSVDAGGGSTENVGVEQEDQFQAWQAGLESSGDEYFGYERANANINNITASGGANAAGISYENNQQGSSVMIKAMSDGTNGVPRTGSETRMKNYTVGVPYVIILKEV